MRSVAIFLLAGLGGCAGPTLSTCHDTGAPYTHERPVQPFVVTVGAKTSAWFADGGPTVLTVHNPTARHLLVHVVCDPSVDNKYIDRGHIEGFFNLAPHTEASRLVEFMSVDARSQVCRVADTYADAS